MTIREVQLFDDSVKSRTIAEDIVVAADIAAGGVSTSELASTCVTSSQVARTTHQSGIVDISAANAGTTVEFPTNFTATPNVVATAYVSGTASIQVNVDSASTANFKIYTDTSGSYSWYASVQPSG